MRVDELRKALRAEPFKPFLVRVADGREYDVRHPEFMMIAPSGKTVAVYGPDDLADFIDTLMITSLHFRNGKAKRPRRK